MAVYALVLTLCAAQCNSYDIDAPLSRSDCIERLVAESDDLGKAFTYTPKGELKSIDVDAVSAYLARFKATEDPNEITEYDFTCEPIKVAYANR